MIAIDMTAKTKKELIEKLEQYQREYPEGGYGTTVSVPWEAGELWIARIVRWESCE
jgi:hypothetical protein